MKLTPADRAEVERLRDIFHRSGAPGNPEGARAYRGLFTIFTQYRLDADAAFTCINRILSASDELSIDDIVLIEHRSPATLLMGMRHEKLSDGRIQLHLDGERALDKFAPRVQWSARDAAAMPRLMTRFYETAFGLLSPERVLDARRHRHGYELPPSACDGRSRAPLLA